jgi:hypothetical protein
MKLSLRLAAAVMAGPLLVHPVRADEILTGQQITAAFAGKTADYVSSKGKKASLVFGSDGSLAISGDFTDTGAWRVAGDTYCAKWKTLRNGKEACFTVEKSSAGYKFLDADGSLNGTVSSVR